MPITTTNSVTIPPQSQVVCDKLWISHLETATTSFEAESVRAKLVLRYYGLDGDGNKVWATGQGSIRTINITDIFADATSDSDVADCLNQIYAVANKYVAAEDAAAAAESSSSSSSSGTPPDDQQGSSSSSSQGV